MIAVEQIPAAIQAVEQMGGKLNDLRMLLQQAKDLSDKNWQIDIGSRFPLLVTVTQQQRTDMIAQYDSFKSQLVALFQTLP